MGDRAVRALVLVVAAALLVAPPARAQSADVGVSGLSPAPGALVDAGMVVLHARLESDHPITAARFVVGAQPAIPATIGAHDPVLGTPVSVTTTLPVGDHALRVEGEDTAARRLQRAWWITATDRQTRRFAGAGRVDTAVAVSVAGFPEDAGAPAAVLARADDFPDALAGVGLATAVGGPLLLSSRDGLSAATARELERVLAPGAVVHLLGGESALGPAVDQAVGALGAQTRRHGGPDRYATAAAVARRLPASSGMVVASGTGFPDALASSAPAAREGWPVVLTRPGQLPEPTAAVLAERGVTDATIVGGHAAVSADVEGHVGRIVARVTRVAGPDRYATAAAVVDAFPAPATGMSLASGVDFPDALSGARHAVALEQPLVLARPSGVPAATGEVIRTHQPRRLDVYGGPAAVADHTVHEALRAAIDGHDGPRLDGSDPAAGQVVAALDAVTVRLDRPVDPARSAVDVEVDGRQVPGALDPTPVGGTLTFRPADGDVAAPDTPWPARVVVRAVTPEGAVGRHVIAFTYRKPDSFYATAGDVALHLPSREVALIGFHESRHLGAQQQVERPTATPRTTLPTRERGTGSHTSADIVASPEQAVLAPVTGRVLRSGPYMLYCRYPDDYVVIEPDGRPGWEVKVLHFHGLRVHAGDRVVAHDTVIGEGPRQLPFTSQVDRFSPIQWPHLHIEVVDPSIPSPPGGDC